MKMGVCLESQQLVELTRMIVLGEQEVTSNGVEHDNWVQNTEEQFKVQSTDGSMLPDSTQVVPGESSETLTVPDSTQVVPGEHSDTPTVPDSTQFVDVQYSIADSTTSMNRKSSDPLVTFVQCGDNPGLSDTTHFDAVPISPDSTQQEIPTEQNISAPVQDETRAENKQQETAQNEQGLPPKDATPLEEKRSEIAFEQQSSQGTSVSNGDIVESDKVSHLVKMKKQRNTLLSCWKDLVKWFLIVFYTFVNCDILIISCVFSAILDHNVTSSPGVARVGKSD